MTTKERLRKIEKIIMSHFFINVIYLAGENCLIVGTMSMDSVIVTVSSEPKDMESFSLITTYGALDCHYLGKEMGTAANDILVKLSQSIPRHYVSNGLV